MVAFDRVSREFATPTAVMAGRVPAIYALERYGWLAYVDIGLRRRCVQTIGNYRLHGGGDERDKPGHNDVRRWLSDRWKDADFNPRASV